MLSNLAYDIFRQSIEDYHRVNHIDQPIKNPFGDTGTLEHLLYKKNWIDTLQWHYEDLIRHPNITPEKALALKRKIDASNQERTDLVEHIDSFFLDKYRHIVPKSNSTLNTETPAWAIDRLSILALKIFHMNEESLRQDAAQEHIARCKEKLAVLLEQLKDLSEAIDRLLSDIEQGTKHMKIYKQMKMYNDPTLNPVIYSSKK